MGAHLGFQNEGSKGIPITLKILQYQGKIEVGQAVKYM